MANFVVVPYVSSDTAYDLYNGGVDLGTNTSNVSYRAAFNNSAETRLVRLGFYTSGSFGIRYFCIASNSTGSIRIILTTKSGSTYDIYSDITPNIRAWDNNWVYASIDAIDSSIQTDLTIFGSLNQCVQAMVSAPIPPVTFPITYRLTNATTTGPNEATIGDTVTVPLQFTEGYGIVNPTTDVYVTNNGVVVPSQYSNGVLTFTMPDPS